MRRCLRRALAAGMMAALALASAACSPEYNWRTINNGDGGYTVMYPGKPTLDERQIVVGGRPMKMQMQAARAGDIVFAVGVVNLPSADPALQASVMQFLENGLARNVGTQPVLHPVEIAVADAAGRAAAYEFTARGKVRDAKRERVVRARFAARGARVYQAVIIGERAAPEEQAEQFLGSLKLY